MPSVITREECRLVQASFLQLEPVAGSVAATFYRRLFELNPALVPLFKTDMEMQGLKFMEKLAVVVTGLDDLASIVALVQALGRGHAGYGVQRADYDTAGEALLWALAEVLGPEFNSELRDAWSAAFVTLSNEMIRASENS
jgi:hemoglobin-like flavoprotein